MILFSGQKLKTPENTRTQKLIQGRKSITNTNSLKSSCLASPIQAPKSMKSQSNIYYPKKNPVQRARPAVVIPEQVIKIKSVEKKILLFNEQDQPSPINSPKNKGYFSLTEEELKELRFFLKEIN